MVRQIPAGLDVEGKLPRWHPDGRRIALGRDTDLLLVDVEDGTETVLASAAGMLGWSFAAAGESVVFSARGPSGTLDILGLLPGETHPQPIVATGLEEHSPALSLPWCTTPLRAESLP